MIEDPILRHLCAVSLTDFVGIEDQRLAHRENRGSLYHKKKPSCYILSPIFNHLVGPNRFLVANPVVFLDEAGKLKKILGQLGQPIMRIDAKVAAILDNLQGTLVCSQYVHIGH